MALEHVTFGERTVPYTLTISDRARQPRLIIAPGSGLRVVAPQGYDQQRLLSFITRKQHWILAHLDRIAALPTAPDAASPLPDHITFLGTERTINVTVAPRKRATVRHDAARFTIIVPEERQARAALEGWLREAARFAIVARVERRAAEMGLTYGQVAIRDQKTRWGSCSHAGNLNFNWRLVLAPPAVLDYVVVHELAHRVEMNHSARFWRIVTRHCPTTKEQRLWLRKHGAALRF